MHEHSRGLPGDGRSLHAYKHIETRRYLHLDADGAAFVFENPDRYRSIPLAEAIAAVFDR